MGIRSYILLPGKKRRERKGGKERGFSKGGITGAKAAMFGKLLEVWKEWKEK